MRAVAALLKIVVVAAAIGITIATGEAPVAARAVSAEALSRYHFTVPGQQLAPRLQPADALGRVPRRRSFCGLH